MLKGSTHFKSFEELALKASRLGQPRPDSAKRVEQYCLKAVRTPNPSNSGPYLIKGITAGSAKARLSHAGRIVGPNARLSQTGRTMRPKGRPKTEPFRTVGVTGLATGSTNARLYQTSRTVRLKGTPNSKSFALRLGQPMHVYANRVEQ